MKLMMLLLCAITLAGCTTATLEPPKYYVLSGVPSELQSIDQAQQVKLGKVAVADYLKSSNIVLQISDHELFFSTNHLWAEPLQVGIEKALANQLGFVAMTTTETLTVDLVIDYFHIIDQDSVILAGSFALKESGEVVDWQSFSLSEPLQNSGYHYAVSVMSELVSRLAEDIREQAKGHQSAHQRSDMSLDN